MSFFFQLTMAAYNAMVPRGLYEVVSITSSDNIEATLYSLPLHNVHNVCKSLNWMFFNGMRTFWELFVSCMRVNIETCYMQ